MFKGTKNKGFTLVEVIVVVVVLAILAAILVPSLIGYIDRAKNGTAIYEAKNVVTACKTLIVQDVDDKGTKSTIAKYNSDKCDYDNILKLAEVKDKGGSIEKLSLEDNTQISDMVYNSSNGIVVEYSNGVYSMLK